MWNVQWVDPNYYIANGIAEPVFNLERPLLHGENARGGVFGVAEVARVGTFWVPKSDPITTDGNWSQTKSGMYVSIPIRAYRTQERGLASIWSLGLQLGLAALLSVRQRTEKIPSECHMILGHECTDMAPKFSCFRCYVGLAFRID